MRFRSGLAFVISVAASLFVSGCGSMPPSTLAHLATFDPLKADPFQVSVAVILPQSLLLRDGDLVMRMKADSPDKATNFDETFLLRIVKTKSDGSRGISVKPTERLQIAGVAEKDLPRMRDIQAKARLHATMARMKDEGTLSVSIKGGCRLFALDSEPLMISIYLKTDGASGYYPVVSNVDMRKEFGAAVMAKVPLCDMRQKS
jgi:hypothetical protein